MNFYFAGLVRAGEFYIGDIPPTTELGSKERCVPFYYFLFKNCCKSFSTVFYYVSATKEGGAENLARRALRPGRGGK
ncbi:MAG: hypothetical protein VR69_13420 [Peptococcaceae bacterium BRH_c4b]|nr:MAG: hypothetical protein VR69_13420 [Peptococcaceae bacterium BRH_c4b]